jgi:hypothetical protein
MSMQKRQLYSSPNGDKWFLCGDPDTDNVFIRHEANVSSGGHVTEMDIGTFLSGGQRNPEHQALLHLIGTLVESNPQVPRQDTRGTPRDGGARKTPWGAHVADPRRAR